MTESGDNKNWNTKQNWIKDVLSKSGTELMEITTTSTKNGIVKKYIKKIAKESPNKMVYYQSMPLIVKSEPSSETQFCTPLGDGPTTTTTNLVQLQTQQQQQQQQLQHQNVAHNYSIHSSKQLSTMVMQQQQQQHQQQQQTSINNSNDNTTYLTTNIKTELLPPGLTVYAASTSAAANNSNHSSASATTPAITTINVSNNAPLTTATVTAIAARKSATIKPQFKCDQCGMTFGSKSAHTSHTKSHAKSITNSNDELVFLSGGGGVSQLQQQFLDISTDEMQLPLIKAPLISKTNAATSAATVASAGISNSAGGGDPYQCNVCQKTFAVPARLIRHYRTHTGERPFECEFCHKLFSVKENLQVHRRIHTKERPYKCDVCGRAFEHSGKLHRHMRIHTGERPHKCSVCGKTFIQSGQLVIHMRTHTGEKPYKCPVEGCGKGFTCSKQLKVHSRTHTGEKPYHCDICFRDFGYNHVLKLHRVQHYGSKCYKCTICDETFKNKKEMEAHIKGHANELPDDEAGGGDDSGASNSGQGSSNSSSLGDTTNSAPSSPQSPTSSMAAAVVATATQTISRNAPKPKKSNAVKRMATISLSPSSPGSSSSAGNTRLSTASPNTLITSASASPALSLTHETEQQQIQQQIYTLYNDNNGRHNAAVLVSGDELPTDLRVLQQQQQPSLGYTSYSNNSNESVSNMYQQQRVATSYTYVLHSPPPLAQILPKQQQQSQQQLHRPLTSHDLTTTTAMGTAAGQAPTINPALLEAASIAKRISHVSLVAEEEEDAETQAALQIMQLNRAQQQTQMQQKQKRHQHKQLVVSDLPYNDDTHEANELIEHYKRGELARHGLHKRYAAPVPKFESSLLHNEIVRQVEAAIAPLRSSTESPERSSSPESDSMMMADRDVMTLPLRKRKLYMNKDQSTTTGNNGANGLATEAAKNAAVMNNSTGGAATNAANAHGNNNELGNKVLRMSSVIQFAKAS